MRRALQAAGMGLRRASLADAQQPAETMVARDGAALGRATFPASISRNVILRGQPSPGLDTTATYDDRRDEGSDARLGDPFCDQLEPIAVCLIVALVDRKVETESTIDLYVNVPWAVQGVALLLVIRRQRVFPLAHIHLRMFPPRSTILSGLSRRRKNVFCVSLVQSVGSQSRALRPT